MKKKLIISFFILLSLVFNPAYSDNFEEAANIYNEAIDVYKQDDVAQSIELFKKAIELDPDFYEAHYNLAQILMSINKNDEALIPLERIVKLKPNDSEALYNLGKIYYKKGFLSKAHEYLIKIADTSAQYESAKLLISKIEKRQDELNLERKVSQRNNVVDIQGKTLGMELSEFSAPSGIALDDRGNIFVASFLENYIYKISIYGQKTILSKSSLIKGPIGLAIDKNNNVYVANYSANNIVKISPNGIASVFADVKKPYCLIYDSEHNRIYVTEQETNKLMKFDL